MNASEYNAEQPETECNLGKRRTGIRNKRLTDPQCTKRNPGQGALNQPTAFQPALSGVKMATLFCKLLSLKRRKQTGNTVYRINSVSNTVKKTGMKKKTFKARSSKLRKQRGNKEANQSLKSANQEAAGNCESIQFSGKILISTQLTKKLRETANLFNSATKSSHPYS